MCGRYYLRKAPKDIRYGTLPEDFSQTKINPFLNLDRFNIAPSQKAPVLRRFNDDLVGAELRWGFLPAWMTNGKPQINARSETVFEKPMFRSAARSTRCMVFASGWYEWQATASGKQPYAFEPEEPVAFAGLWTPGRSSDGAADDSYLVLTTDANETASAVHNRMPVTLKTDQWLEWIETGNPELLRPFEGRLQVWPVTRKVGNPRYDAPDCVERLA